MGLMQMGMVFGRDLYTLKTQIWFEYLRYSHSLVFFEDPSVLQSEESMFFWYCCTGSLRPTFVPARRVGLAVKLPSAFALEGQGRRELDCKIGRAHV